ncbi:MAG TPA: C40 family peptidase, partial [Mobilitalea sp.]|nr:C40 family peptidase [Mobilitalea sp.]
KLAAEEAAKKAEEARRAQEGQNNHQNDNQDNHQDDHQDSTPSSGSSSSLSGLRNEIITYALKFVGNPYVWGGESLTNGADCSGFVRAIYGDFGYNIPRTSREQAAGAGKIVDESDIQPGDLIFYTNSSGMVNHVAMYIGNGQIVQAANSRQGIITSRYNYRSIYRVRRIVY